MPRNHKSKIDWDAIDTVLLDLDGTLIDKHFDDYFWEKAIPREYAKKHAMSVREAERELLAIYQTQKYTSRWGDILYWERRIDMSLLELRMSLKHMCVPHPHTRRFLRFLQRKHKPIHIVTAAPYHEAVFKLTCIGVKPSLIHIHSELDLHASKKRPLFWKRLHAQLHFNPQRTLFVDDSEEDARAAQKAGIAHIIFKGKNSSRRAFRRSSEFITIRHFDDLL